MYRIGDKVEFYIDFPVYENCRWFTDDNRFLPTLKKHFDGIILNIYYNIGSVDYQVKTYAAGELYCIKEYQIVKLMEKKQMKKSDLENRMIVELRNGDRYMVFDDMIMGQEGWCSLNSFKEDLTYKIGNERDIMKVYHKSWTLDINNNKHNEIWSREATKEMHFSNDLDFISDITDCLNDCKKRGAEKVTITFKMN